MEELKAVITKLVDLLKDDILNFYKIYEGYLIDLVLSKNINISSSINSSDEKRAKKNILLIIASTNSALITIGVSKSQLTTDHELYQTLYEQKNNNFSNYKSFLQIGLKDYINKHLFIMILEHIINKNSNVIENLDLFDLLPYEFRNKLNKFRNENIISKKGKKSLRFFSKDPIKYFDPSAFTFKGEDLKIEDPIEKLSEEDILEKLHEARQENINALSISSNQINNENLLNRVKPSFLNYFISFPKLGTSISEKIKINVKQLRNFIKSSPEFLDLENLFYGITIFKMLGEELELEPGYIKNILDNFISGSVFSTGRYHKPNPSSIYYGLSIISTLDLFTASEVVDLLDIEMVLENEIINFIPEKLSLNFYTVLSLKMLKKSGGIITDKTHLIEPLVNLDIFNLEEFKPSSEMFFYLGILKLLDERADFSKIQTTYLAELKKNILPNGSVNENITDTARSLLILVLLNANENEISLTSDMLKFLNQKLDFFIESQEFGEFSWNNNKFAFKIELRMLFWILLVLSQFIN